MTSLREALTKEERMVFSLMGSTVWSLSTGPGRECAARAEVVGGQGSTTAAVPDGTAGGVTP